MTRTVTAVMLAGQGESPVLPDDAEEQTWITCACTGDPDSSTPSGPQWPTQPPSWWSPGGWSGAALDVPMVREARPRVRRGRVLLIPVPPTPAA